MKLFKDLRLDQTTGLSIRTPEDLSRFIVELQQRELALKDKNSAITSRKTIFLFWRVTITSIDFTDLVTWQKMPV